ncbi:hypothetical protein ACFPM7_05210 [Actinokineospora guangxiensis]|uniref:Uncharacterized protein n=1 Tax=Actinokineospora guangxiensis TaxID=1490288 RepID=A0ABW0EGB8_9PSEU
MGSPDGWAAGWAWTTGCARCCPRRCRCRRGGSSWPTRRAWSSSSRCRASWPSPTFAPTAYFALRVERTSGQRRAGRQLRERFPKFVLGFLAASVIATVYTGAVGSAEAKPVVAIVNGLAVVLFSTFTP